MAATPTMPIGRMVRITVLNGLDQPAEGADVTFSIDGALFGGVTIGQTPASISLPDPNVVLEVTVFYVGQVQSSQIPPGQDSYTFRFPRAFRLFRPPVARCPDGTVGQP